MPARRSVLLVMAGALAGCWARSTLIVGSTPCDATSDCAGPPACEGEPCGLSCAGAASASAFDAFGDGTAESPYLVCTPAQLLDLMDPAHASAWSAHLRLGADLDMSGFGAASSPPVRPIGNSASPFTGVFDGGGHRIQGLTYEDATQDCVGLFGVVSGWSAVVRDLVLESASIHGHAYVGALAGRLERGATVSACSSTGVVTASGSYVGGLAGVVGGDWVTAAAPAFVSASWSSATVSNDTGDNNTVGGLVGNIGNSSLCINSYATGDVTAGLDFAGGLAGGSTGFIVNSFASGRVTGGSSVGGLVGNATGEISSSFALGNVSGADAANTGSLVGSLWSATVSNSYSYGGATCSVAPSGNCHGPVSGESTDGTLAHFESAAFAPLSSWDFTHVWQEGAGLPALHLLPFDSAAFGTCAAHLNEAPFAGGYGSPEAPYLICTAAQLAAVATDPTPWHAYRLMADIDVAGQTAFPIGSDAAAFRGLFSGGGKSITHLAANGTSSTSYGGLFGVMYGFISQLGLRDATLTGGDYQGAIAGDLRGGAIVDCYATGSVSAAGDRVGGLLGHVAAEATVERCYFAGSVEAGTGGGLVGSDDGSRVSDSFASAAVTVSTGGGPLTSSTIDASNGFDETMSCAGCTNTSGTAHTPTSYFYDPAHAPLSHWDFSLVWQSNAPSAFPILR